jgi:hypothetical protein
MTLSSFPTLPHLIRVCVTTLGVTVLAVAAQGAEGTAAPGTGERGLRQWTEDFSDAAAFGERWVPYGRLANGQWAQAAKARPEWWQLVDGALRGQNFPEEKHPAGISRRIAGGELRLRFRVKIAEESVGTIRFFGKSIGVLPTEKTDNHVTALEISASRLRIWNGNRLREAGEPARFHNTNFEKVENLAIAPDAWHDVVIEVRGRQVKALLDGKDGVTFTLEQDQPMESLSLEADGNKKEIGVVWFDDFALEPL